MNRRIILLFFALAVLCCNAQQLPNPAVRFSFNNGSQKDEITGNHAQFFNALSANDRFGNENHAIYLYGNSQSYVNLGSFSELKPEQGSVSLWVKVEHPIMTGTGMHYNPIILTRNADRNDFNEAYSLYYMCDTKKLAGNCVLDSTSDLGLYSKEVIQMNDWKHLVLTFSKDSTAFYLNGILQVKFVKPYPVKYLQGDPVLVGTTKNPKNDRSTNATVDDIEIYPYVLTPEEIRSLYNAPNPNAGAIFLYWVYVVMGLLVVVAAIYFFVRYRIRKALERKLLQLEQSNMALETELRVNRALMNPHFVFNALNALQNLILNVQTDRANDYLVKFSKMIRKLLESNMSDLISVEMEVELINRYLEIEDLRFDENIKHNICIDPAIEPSKVYIPVMMIQPFVENAIWHGLLKKQGEKKLTISFDLVETKYILCTIEDNGVGRKKKKSSVVFDKTSLATSFIEQRLQLFNQIKNLKCFLSLEYKPDQQGAIFKILLPILKHEIR